MLVVAEIDVAAQFHQHFFIVHLEALLEEFFADRLLAQTRQKRGKGFLVALATSIETHVHEGVTLFRPDVISERIDRLR